MKRLLLFIAVLFVAFNLAAQSKWDGFFKPVPKDMLHTKAVSSQWLFRPTVALTATTFKLNIIDGKFSGFQSSFLSKAGMGLSYAHYIEVEGLPYNNFSVNGLVLLPTGESASVALAATVTALKYVNVGIGYDIIKGVPIAQNFFVLTGVTLTF